MKKEELMDLIRDYGRQCDYLAQYETLIEARNHEYDDKVNSLEGLSTEEHKAIEEDINLYERKCQLYGKEKDKILTQIEEAI